MDPTIDNPVRVKVYGEAVPQGSKDAFVPTYKGGKPVRRHRAPCPGALSKDVAREIDCECPLLVTLKESSGGLDVWRETVGWSCRQQYKGPVLDGAIGVELIFYRPRPADHFGTGRNAGLLKDGARAYPTIAPDLDKIERAIMDALKGVLWVDDARIVRKHSGKDYAAPGETSRVEIAVWRMPVQTVGEMVEKGMVETQRPLEDAGQLTLSL